MPFDPAHPIYLIRPICPINFPTKSKRYCKRATLESSSGPTEKLEEPLSQNHSGLFAPTTRRKVPFKRGGN